MSVAAIRSKADWLDQGQYPFESRHLAVEGGDMHYVDEGKGEPIVFVHGFPTWSFMWRGLVRDLSLKHRCIAMDHIGFGLSDKPAQWSYSLEAHARNYQKLLEHLGIESHALVVHDLGGPIAFHHALEHPDKVRSITAVNSFMWSLKSDDNFVKFDHKVNGPIGKMALTSTPIGLNKMLHDMVEQKQKVSPKIYPQYTGPYHNSAERQGPFNFARAYLGSSVFIYDQWVRREALAGKPLLATWGAKDKLYSLNQFNKWRENWPNVEAVTFPESGHLVFEEQANEFEAAVYMFVDGQGELQRVSKAIHSDFAG